MIHLPNSSYNPSVSGPPNALGRNTQAPGDTVARVIVIFVPVISGKVQPTDTFIPISSGRITRHDRHARSAVLRACHARILHSRAACGCVSPNVNEASQLRGLR